MKKLKQNPTSFPPGLTKSKTGVKLPSGRHQQSNPLQQQTPPTAGSDVVNQRDDGSSSPQKRRVSSSVGQSSTKQLKGTHLKTAGREEVSMTAHALGRVKMEVCNEDSSATEELPRAPKHTVNELQEAAIEENAPSEPLPLPPQVVSESSRKLPLHRAASSPHKAFGVEMIESLIDLGANVDERDEDNCTFLHQLLKKGTSITLDSFHRLVSFLVEKKLLTSFNTPGWKLHVTPFLWAVFSLEVRSETLALMSQNGVNFKAVDREGDGVLHYAVMGGASRSFLSNLIKYGADPKQLNKEGENLIHLAAQRGSVETLEFFKKKGINLKGVDFCGNSPLHQVCRYGSKNFIQTVNWLIQSGANINAPNEDHSAPIHEAALNTDQKAGNRMISHLIHGGADVFSKDKLGNTFMHLILTGSVTPSPLDFHKIAAILIEKGHANLFNIRGSIEMNEANLFQLAVEGLQLDDRTLALLHGNGVHFNPIDARGYSLLSYAVKGRRTIKFLSELVKFGADPKYVQWQNLQTLLHLTAEVDADWGAGVMKWLIKNGVNKNAKDCNGNTALHLTIRHGSSIGVATLEKVEALVERGADIKIANKNGETASQIAALLEYPAEILNLLRIPK